MGKKKMIIAIAALLALPMAAAATTLEEQQVVSGHAVFADMSGFDENIAAIAGHAESRVVWFNGQTIMNTVSEGFIYAAESGNSCGPLRGENFTFQGYDLSFIDPNNVSHIVAHYTYECPASLFNPTGFLEEELFGVATYSVWVTHTHAVQRDSPIVAEGDAGRLYNFALAVDLSEFDSTGELTHSGEGGRTTSEINSGDSYCPEEEAHHCGEGGGNDEHTHRTADVDLYYSQQDRVKTHGNSTQGHPGTLEGCDADDHCKDVRDGEWVDPDAST
jgi:hypothetical protein